MVTEKDLRFMIELLSEVTNCGIASTLLSPADMEFTLGHYLMMLRFFFHSSQHGRGKHTLIKAILDGKKQKSGRERV